MNVAAASCERIVKQPVPLAYVRNASRFLSFYLLSLPCALVGNLGWVTIPASLFVNWSFITILRKRDTEYFMYIFCCRITSYFLIFLTVLFFLLSCCSYSTVLSTEIGAFIEEPFDKNVLIINIAQLTSVVQTDLSELLGEQVCSPAMWDMDQTMVEESRKNSRLLGDDTFFAYT